MSLHRRNPKRDANEGPIVDTLEALGFSVVRLSIPGGPDLLVGRHQQTLLAEVKAEDGQLRPEQVEWQARWNGSPVVILRTVEDACDLAQSQWPLMTTGKKKR
jgi:hypothetical protein